MHSDAGLLALVVPIAHNIGVPHADPGPPPETGDAPSTVIILVVLVLTLTLIAALVWMRHRTAQMAARETDAGPGPETPGR